MCCKMSEKKNMLKDQYENVLDDIRFLHYCTNKLTFSKKKNKILKKWKSANLQSFIDYFKKQWLEGAFKN